MGWKDIAVRVRRQFIEDHLSFIAAGVTFFAILAFIPGLAALVSIYGYLSDPADIQAHINLLAVVFMAGLAVLFRWGPCRANAQWQWITWGSVFATLMTLVGAALFSLYVANFGNYNKTYGSMGSIVILMFWIYISALFILLGAEINSEIEHQTARDTTTGDPQPMGQRNAYVADTVGRAHPEEA